MKLKLLDLFSGIGGFSLGLESTGHFETIAFVEKDKFCQQVLKKNFKNIPIESEVRNVKGDRYAADIVTGGFPCQPFSVAGKRRGTDDDRYLWDETIRIIRECKPRWFIGENVEGIINIQEGVVLRQVQDDLEKEGFQVQCLVIPASGIGAWHQRKRVWIVAHSNSNRDRHEIRGSNGEEKEIQREYREKDNTTGKPFGANTNVSNTNSFGHRGWSSEGCTNERWSFLSREQEGREMGSETSRCNRDVSNSKIKRSSRSRGEKSNKNKNRMEQGKEGEQSKIWSKSKRCDGISRDVSNSNIEGLERHELQSDNKQQRQKTSTDSSTEEQCTWWQAQSSLCGVPNGISYELDKSRANRIKSLGNSIVPLIARELGVAIMKAEQDG